MKTFIRKKMDHTTLFRLIKPVSDPVMTRQRKPEETYYNFANVSMETAFTESTSNEKVSSNICNIFYKKGSVYKPMF